MENWPIKCAAMLIDRVCNQFVLIEDKLFDLTPEEIELLEANI